MEDRFSIKYGNKYTKVNKPPIMVNNIKYSAKISNRTGDAKHIAKIKQNNIGAKTIYKTVFTNWFIIRNSLVWKDK